MVQQASFRIDSLVELSKGSKQPRALQLRMTWVWVSSPVTIFPTARSAAWTTFNELCIRSSTRRRHTFDSIIFCIFSLGPSLRYEMAQQASASTSTSWLYRRRASIGSAGSTLLNSTGGFLPRHKLDKHHTAFLVIVMRVCLDKIL